jgi:hypothetical protein
MGTPPMNRSARVRRGATDAASRPRRRPRGVPSGGTAAGGGPARSTATDDDGVVADILARLRAPGGYDAFAAQVRGARCCRRPVRLSGRVTRRGEDAGRALVFDTRDLPDQVLLKACGTRRETLCPPCASIYRGDAFALVAAGLRGGKGVSDEVSAHPAVLLTLTAPSFGAVHRRGPGGTCHRGGRRCPHGVALVCGARHADDDPVVGQALCPRCYDYEGAVLFNASVSELWRRTVIYGLRALGGELSLSVRQVEHNLRLSYVKVVEFQRRGSVHLHAVVRVDARHEDGTVTPDGVDADALARALVRAAASVSVPHPSEVDKKRLRWGHQVDAAVITDESHGRRRAASYLAKYATKGSDDTGVLDRRLRAGIPPRLRLSGHLRSLVEHAWTLGGEERYQDLHLRAWVHCLGFRGHFLTKSRRYSTTFASLRAERQRWTISARARSAEVDEQSDAGGSSDVGVEDDPGDWDTHGAGCEATWWELVGVGYASVGDAWLAEGLADEVRMGRILAREATADELAAR